MLVFQLLQASALEGCAGRRIPAAEVRRELRVYQPLRRQAAAPYCLGRQDARHAVPGVHLPLLPASLQVTPLAAQGMKPGTHFLEKPFCIPLVVLVTHVQNVQCVVFLC